jgi:hypothetical protein
MVQLPSECPLALFIFLLFVTPGFLGAQATPPYPYGSCAHPLFPSRRKLSGLDRVCIRRHDGRHVEFQWRAGESDGAGQFRSVPRCGHHFGGAERRYHHPQGQLKDPGPNEFLDPATQGIEYWQLSGSNVLHTSPPPTIPQTDPPIPAARIHDHHPDNDYSVWNRFSFFATTDPNSDFCGANDFFTAYDKYGADYDVGVDPRS